MATVRMPIGSLLFEAELELGNPSTVMFWSQPDRRYNKRVFYVDVPDADEYANALQGAWVAFQQLASRLPEEVQVSDTFRHTRFSIPYVTGHGGGILVSSSGSILRLRRTILFGNHLSSFQLRTTEMVESVCTTLRKAPLKERELRAAVR